MKKAVSISLTLLITLSAFSQNPAPTNWENFSPDCSTDFWTITVDGYIQQWSLINGVITGGDTLLSGGGNSLAYCGDKNDPKFYSNSYSTVGLTYYEPDSGWINIPTSFTIDNNGGHLNDHFYRIEGAIIQIMAYWDGTNLLTIDSLQGEFFAGTADIAVNTSGQAWVSTGSAPGNMDSLKVYTQSGKINAYAFQQNMQGYGSFFLNDTLYLGTIQGSIYPVIINGTSAQLGTPIAFPSRNFTDMASCQRKESSTLIHTLPETKPNLFPNPTRGYVSLPIGIEKSDIMIYNSQGHIIAPKLDGRILDLSEQPSGMYIIKLTTGGAPRFYRIKKL